MGIRIETRLYSRYRGDTWIEATIPQLQSLMPRGKLSSRELTLNYLNRIRELNPILHAVIETNPQAIAIAAQLDNERRGGRVRGPQHGVPVLLKDNIATNDLMETTAGSLALVGSRVPADAPLVKRLRDAGAVILGKANLSEWANFRGMAADWTITNGWTARGGFTRNPYILDFDACGSSTGSAAAVAANLCAAAVGTETDGSILCPAGNTLGVGIKPTIGLVSQDGIIPISHSQDTAGPLARTVTDAAILLAAMAGNAAGYTASLRPGALRGARIGVDRQFFSADFFFGSPDMAARIDSGLAAMEDLGAILVDLEAPGDISGAGEYADAEFTVLLCEFKDDMAEYLAGLSRTSLRTLADLIQFNRDHCEEEMKYFGQEIFEIAEETGGRADPGYRAARDLCVAKSRAEGIDGALARHSLDAIVGPSYSWASMPAAVAGYPSITVPVGLSAEGRPAGLYFYGGVDQEQRLIALAYDLEQALKSRVEPRFLGAEPPEPPDAGICAAPAAKLLAGSGAARSARHLGTGRRMCRCL